MVCGSLVQSVLHEVGAGAGDSSQYAVTTPKVPAVSYARKSTIVRTVTVRITLHWLLSQSHWT